VVETDNSEYIEQQYEVSTEPSEETLSSTPSAYSGIEGKPYLLSNTSHEGQVERGLEELKKKMYAKFSCCEFLKNYRRSE
jgi:hypothetical protein